MYDENEEVNLTDKQKRFCEEYLIDLNATKSAIRSGYSEKTAHSIGFENLTKPEIQNYISLLQKQKSEELNITQNQILTELSKVAFGDVRNLFDENGKLLNINEVENLVSGGIKSVTLLTEKYDLTASGDGVYTTIKKVETHDKLKAIDLLNKMLGYYGKDNDQRRPINNINLKDAIKFSDNSES